MKPNTFITIAVALFVLLKAGAQNDSIRFEHDTPLNALLAESKQVHKPILIDCYAVWCVPCKWMDSHTLRNDTITQFINANFISAKIDMEKGEGPALRTQFEVQAYPTYLFIDSTGKLLSRKTGGATVSDFMIAATASLDPAKREYANLQLAFGNGTITTTELMRYMYLRKFQQFLPTNDQADFYFRSIDPSLVFDTLGWRILRKYVTDAHCTSANYLFTHREGYNALYSADTVNTVITTIYTAAMSKVLYARTPDTTKYQPLRAEFLDLGFKADNQLIVAMDIQYYSLSKKWPEYVASCGLYINKFSANDWQTVNNICWGFYQNEAITDPADLDSAIVWMERSLKINENFFNMDTYSALLEKRGNSKASIKAAKKALEYGKAAHVPENFLSETQARVDRLSKKK